MEHNGQLKLTAPTVHCTLPFYITPCSVHLVGSAVVEHNLVFQPDDDRKRGKSLWRDDWDYQTRWYSYDTVPKAYKNSSLRKPRTSSRQHGRMDNKTNQRISCCETLTEEFVWRMEGRLLVKGNDDKSIPKNYCDGGGECWLLRMKWTVV